MSIKKFHILIQLWVFKAENKVTDLEIHSQTDLTILILFFILGVNYCGYLMRS